MTNQLIKFKEKLYPSHEASGFAARFAFPFAKEMCKGFGVDIGYSKPEWKLPGAEGVDLCKVCFSDGREAFEMNGVSAVHLPSYNYDYIFSSHCLEHLPNWIYVLDYWMSVIKSGGTLFLYLPHPSQEYWKPWNNRKHVNILEPSHIEDYFSQRTDLEYYLVTGFDLNHSYYAVAIKR